MTRVEPFGKVAERFASQQETRFSVRFLVRFPQAFIKSLFQAFQKVVKSPPSADKIEPPFPLPEFQFRELETLLSGSLIDPFSNDLIKEAFNLFRNKISLAIAFHRTLGGRFLIKKLIIQFR
ncbi:hypothetical protein AVEN_249749-1 [Araneus ventricosus]|uniref:Uncharacterized protein n=1 Tax=Araneus ventricosus TaxID=182803 RepID=A0A4Y2C5G4_ARAVE|nr:hypothetical protein AVEN_249749-1 [Araneus ventricosus]